ncbi:MAG: PASTA domain-containing protein [Solirubrobacteraceae bacterium]
MHALRWPSSVPARRLDSVCALLAGALLALGCAPGVARAATDRYTVQFESTMTDEFLGLEGADHGKFVNEYAATVGLSSAAKGAPYTGSTTGRYLQTTGSTELAGKCEGTPDMNRQIDESGNPAPFRVVSFTPATAAGGSAVLTLNVGMPTETYRNEVTVSACNLAPPSTIPNWWADWGVSHKGSMLTSEANEFQLTLTRGSGSDAGSVTYSGVVASKGNLNATESSKITVTEAECTVPDVVGDPRALAEEAIEEAGCKVGAVKEKKSTVVAIGNVISSNPGAGAKEPPETPVALVVAKGGKVKRKCRVPALKGDTLAAARRALRKAECSLGKVKKAASSKIGAGKVISSNPKKGKSEKTGFKVALVLSKGSGKCKVPALEGDLLPVATKALQKAGCSLGKVGAEKSTKVAAGKVISSKPKKGSKLKGGSKVAVTISLGKV